MIKIPLAFRLIKPCPNTVRLEIKNLYIPECERKNISDSCKSYMSANERAKKICPESNPFDLKEFSRVMTAASCCASP